MELVWRKRGKGWAEGDEEVSKQGEGERRERAQKSKNVAAWLSGGME